MNNSTSVVGSASISANEMRAFLWENGVLANLNSLSTTNGWVLHDARGINNFGTIVGWGLTNGQEEAFIYQTGNVLRVGLLLGATNSFAYGVNNSNQVVGACTLSNGLMQAFLWRAGSLSNLNQLLPPDSNWDLREARGINDIGQIVGWGVINGQEHAFILSPNTSPSVTLTNPVHNALLAGPLDVDLHATASDPDGSVVRVEFFDGSTFMGDSLADPFVIALLNVTEGQHAFSAVAVDNAGARSTSSVVNVTIAAPPSIEVGPLSRRILTGSNGTFTVTATGTSPLAYQWLFNGASIAGATNSNYGIVNVQTIHAGSYSVRITNSVGSVTSANAALTAGVDPSNMGKGDWIYFLSMATNKLGGNVPGVTNLSSLMSYERLQGMQFIVVKAGDGDTIWDQFNAELVNSAHSAGLKVFGYGRVFGTNIPGETAVATNVLALGADGFVIDAEIEYESQSLPGNTAAAETYCAGIRAVYPTAFLAHSPFALISSHPTFPYVAFGKHCNVVMPQCYWKSFGISPSNMVNQLDTEWRNWQNSLTGSATNAIKPIAPVAQGWNPSSSLTTTGSEITEFVNRLKNNSNPASVGGYKGVSFWRADLHTPDMWAGISGSSVGNPTGAPLIVTQPQSCTVSAGSSATFSVVAIGSGALGYQWRRNGVSLSGATGSSYSRSNIQPADVGAYSVIVSNAPGTVLSADAILSFPSANLWTETFESGLGNWTAISSALANSSVQNHTVSGTNAAKVLNTGNRMYRNLGTEVSGYSKLVFWIYDGTQTRAYGEVRAHVGSGYATGSFQQILAIGRYGVGFGTGTGTLASEVVDTTRYQGRVYSGSNAGWFNLNAAGAPGRSAGWHKFEIERLSNGSTINFYVDGVLGKTISNATVASWDSITMGSVGSGTTAGDAWFDDISAPYFGIPEIGIQPLSQTVNAGTTVTFSVSVNNTATSYHWRKNGINIAGATNASLTLPSVSSGSEGEYSVLIGNGIGSVVSSGAVLKVIVAPTILVQPRSQTVSSGVLVSFKVVVDGTAPFTYQWRKNGVALDDMGNTFGSNSDELVLNNVTQVDAASYSVVVFNPAGWLSSANAVLSLNGSSVFTDDFESGTLNKWTTVPGANSLGISSTKMNPVTGTKTASIINSLDKMYHNLNTEVGGRARATFWIFDDGGTLTRSFGEARSFSGSGFNNGGLQQVLAIGNYKTPFEPNTGLLEGEQMDGSRYQGRVFAGANAGWFNLNAYGAPYRSMGWHKFEMVRSSDGSVVHFYVDGIFSRTIPAVAAATWDTLFMGSYGTGLGEDSGNGWFDDVKVEYLNEVITTQPVGKTVIQGESATFTVGVTGSNPVYQWKKRGIPIVGATLASFSINNAQASDAADYSVIVSTDTGTEPSTIARLTVIVPVAISAQPVSLIKNQGELANFQVTATGTSLSYQWKKNGQNIPGATDYLLLLPNLTPSDEAAYVAVISNPAGAVTSSTATLTVIVPPLINTPPVNQFRTLGSTATFTVSATGSALTYQWKKDGVALVDNDRIAGANSPTLTLSDLILADSGYYAVIVSNPAGLVGASASLTVQTEQQITFDAIPDKTFGDVPFSLNAVASSALPVTFTIVSGETAASITMGIVTLKNAGTVTIRASQLGNADYLAAPPVERTFNILAWPATIHSKPEIYEPTEGQSLTLIPEVSGASPLSYQWLKLGTPIPNATSSSFTLLSVSESDDGIYELTLANADATVTAAIAVVRVIRGLDTTPPVVTITSPLDSPIYFPKIQVRGFSTEPLVEITYDLETSSGESVGNRGFVIEGSARSPSLNPDYCEFQCFDVPLSAGNNLITIKVKDRAGNISVVERTIVRSLADSVAPVVDVLWPMNETLVGSGNITLRGVSDDPCSIITALVFSGGTQSGPFNALVERNGEFSIANLPLASPINTIQITATDSAENASTTELTVSKSSLDLKISYAYRQGGNTIIMGSAAQNNHRIYIDGVEAQLTLAGARYNWTVTVPTQSLAAKTYRAIAIPMAAAPLSGGESSASATSGNPEAERYEDLEPVGVKMSSFNKAFSHSAVTSSSTPPPYAGAVVRSHAGTGNQKKNFKLASGGFLSSKGDYSEMQDFFYTGLCRQIATSHDRSVYRPLFQGGGGTYVGFSSYIGCGANQVNNYTDVTASGNPINYDDRGMNSSGSLIRVDTTRTDASAKVSQSIIVTTTHTLTIPPAKEGQGSRARYKLRACLNNRDSIKLTGEH